MMKTSGEKWFAAKPLAPDHLSKAVSDAQKHLPTPLERLRHPDPKTLDLLQRKICTASSSENILDLSHRLSSFELHHLFPLLLQDLGDDSKEDKPFHDRIDLILRERACPSLYRSGFLAYQTSYDQPTICRHFSLLCSILKIRQESGLGPSFTLFSDFLDPESRPLIRKILQTLNRQKDSLQTFIQRYELTLQLPLAQQLINQAALSVSDSLFVQSQDLFAHVLQTVDDSLKFRLVKRFLTRKDLAPEDWNAYCQVLYRQLGKPSEAHPVWRQLTANQRQHFSDWVLAATIGTHCRENPDKALLYLRHAVHVLKLEAYDEDTLVLHFPGFRLVDSKKEPDMAVFYDEDQATKRIDRDKMHPASETVPRRRVDEAIRRGRCRGIIGLPFSDEGIKFSHIFMDLCMKEKVYPQQSWQDKMRKARRRRFFLPDGGD